MSTYHLLTFGCQMNVNDSWWLAQALETQGFAPSTLEQADVILINTCAVRAKPEHKVRATLERINHITKANPNVLVGVLGCVAQQLGQTLLGLTPQVRLVAGPDAIHMLPNIIAQLLEQPNQALSLLDFTKTYIERPAIVSQALGPCAYVNIMQGCDNFCTYCIVPYTRGRQKSRSTQAILKECQDKLALGAKELTLLGQNVNAFGQDQAGDGTSFAELLAQIASLPNLVRLRYTSPHPKDMTPQDIQAFGKLAPLCPSLHLPLQSGSSSVLKRMARRYSQEQYLDLVASLRDIRPDLALTTDIIVGFPGETAADLDATLKVMEACRFSASYSFCYSDRPGCKATTFLDKIPPTEQHARLLAVQALQDKLTQDFLTSRLNQETTLLLEQPSLRRQESANSWQGRDPYGTIVHVLLPEAHDYTGQCIKVQITGHKKHCLIGQQKSALW